jgi:hypothetical protein
MGAFELGKGVESRSREILRPFIKARAFDGQVVYANKGPLAPLIQRTMGDLLYNSDADTIYAAEVKAEMSNKHGNFFLEVWSNRSRGTPGWLVSLQADILLYHFIEQDELWVIPFKRLQGWARDQIERFPLRVQSKYTQLNDTWGRCVPILTIKEELGLDIPFAPLRELGAAA